MQLKVFAIDAQGGEEAGEELNRFLRGHRVVAVKRRLVEQAGGAYWTFCVEYLERGVTTGGPGTADRAKRGVDYKEILSAEDFAVFAKLRDLRKEMAEKEGVPPYAVSTNEQLAAMVTGRMETRTALATIDSYACRKGKGQVAAGERARHYAQTFPWFLKATPSPWSASAGPAMAAMATRPRQT